MLDFYENLLYLMQNFIVSIPFQIHKNTKQKGIKMSKVVNLNLLEFSLPACQRNSVRRADLTGLASVRQLDCASRFSLLTLQSFRN